MQRLASPGTCKPYGDKKKLSIWARKCTTVMASLPRRRALQVKAVVFGLPTVVLNHIGSNRGEHSQQATGQSDWYGSQRIIKYCGTWRTGRDHRYWSRSPKDDMKWWWQEKIIPRLLRNISQKYQNRSSKAIIQYIITDRKRDGSLAWIEIRAHGSSRDRKSIVSKTSSQEAITQWDTLLQRYYRV